MSTDNDKTGQKGVRCACCTWAVKSKLIAPELENVCVMYDLFNDCIIQGICHKIAPQMNGTIIPLGVVCSLLVCKGF